MKYYFDTSVWLAYFNEKEFYHKEALLWFEKIRKEGHELYVSDLISKEMRNKPPFKEYLAVSGKLCTHSIIDKEDIEYARMLSERYDLPSADIKHILHAKRNGFIAVSADITHWPKIARLLGFQSAYHIPEIHSL
jgi:predicted nucleic acid-binding protein